MGKYTVTVSLQVDHPDGGDKLDDDLNGLLGAFVMPIGARKNYPGNKGVFVEDFEIIGVEAS